MKAFNKMRRPKYTTKLKYKKFRTPFTDYKHFEKTREIKSIYFIYTNTFNKRLGIYGDKFIKTTNDKAFDNSLMKLLKTS